MGVYLMEMFGVSLALTIGIELAAAWFLLCRGKDRCGEGERSGEVLRPPGGKDRCGEGKRSGKVFEQHRGKRKKGNRWIVIVVLVNVLTNPPAVLLCWLGQIYLPALPQLPVQLGVEVLVVSVEAYVYRCFAGRAGWGIERPFLLSVVANSCSWLGGRWLMEICGRVF